MDRTHAVAARIAMQCTELSKTAESVGLEFLSLILGMAVVEAKRHQAISVVLPMSERDELE